MKEAIGGTSLFFIVIVILSVFAIYISLTINWSTAYKVKDEIVFYLEKNKGMNEDTCNDIQKYTSNIGYAATGTCELGLEEHNCSQSFSVRTDKCTVYNNKASNFCIRRFNYPATEGGMPERSYYRVKVFFQLDVPFISDLKIGIEGETSTIVYPKDTYFPSSKSNSSNKMDEWCDVGHGA